MDGKLTARLVGSTGGALPKIVDIDLPAAGWTGGTGNVWQKIVEIADAANTSKIDLQPTAAQLAGLQNTGIALMVENSGGVFTVYAFGGKPAEDLTLQATITEISRINGGSESTVISGNTVGSITGPLLYPKSI